MEAYAARARGGWHDYRQPDGTTLSAELRGDEWFHYYVTRDGVPLVSDTEVGALCYAQVLSSGLASTGIVAHEADRRLAEEKPYVISLARLAGAEAAARASVQRRITLVPHQDWDSAKVYKSPVLLIEFEDFEFGMENPKAFYDSLFNQPGFNQGDGPGCVADYFRDQSGGLVNMQFDVIGPFKTSYKAAKSGDSAPTIYRKVIMQAADSLDFTQYDWFGTGDVQQVVIVYAGYGGNDSGAEGHIWPSTGTINAINIDGARVTTYTGSPERWYRGSIEKYTSCGIGTICHEFSHCLGLPDLYPVGGDEPAFSIVDEWDLMDGGNYTNWGWCPCNYTPLEKMLLGWLKPEELTESASIRSLKPVAQGGSAYQILNDNYPDEYYLLENRQQQGWDACIPGHGLLVYHVDYSESVWNSNKVNSKKSRHRFELMHADNLDYDDWDNIVGAGKSPYLYSQKRCSRILSTSPYPYVTDDAEVRELTDTSTPAATTNNRNKAGEYLMSKPLTGIFEHEDSTVSFDLMGGTLPPVGIQAPLSDRHLDDSTYDLLGHRLPASFLQKGLYIVRRKDGTTYKRIR